MSAATAKSRSVAVCGIPSSAWVTSNAIVSADVLCVTLPHAWVVLAVTSALQTQYDPTVPLGAVQEVHKFATPVDAAPDDTNVIRPSA